MTRKAIKTTTMIGASAATTGGAAAVDGRDAVSDMGTLILSDSVVVKHKRNTLPFRRSAIRQSLHVFGVPRPPHSDL